MVRTIQHRMCEYLNEQENCVIEVCPTSNSRLGYVKQREHHSLPTFLKYPRLNLLISSDDPGIFDTSILKELELAKNYGDMNQNHFVKILDNSKKFSSEYLTQ